MKKYSLWVLLILLALTSGSVFAQSTTFTVELTGAAEVTPGDPDGTGTVVLTVDPSGEFCFDIAVENIDAPNRAHIHEGAAGQNGPIEVIFFDLVIEEPVPVTFNGCVDAFPAIAQEILANPENYYVNIHNDAFPAGAVRGQLAGPNIAVTGFDLVDAGTGDVIGSLDDGGTVDLGALPEAINIVAQTNPAEIGSVGLNLNGAVRLENLPPYAVGGDRNGDFNALDLPVGENTVTAVPWTERDGQGERGDAFTVTFTLVEQAAETVTLGSASDDELGDIIVAENGFTLYQFIPDDNNCVDGCLEVWPPVLAESVENIQLADGLAGEVGIFEAVDGRSQVTYNGVPLYFFSNDAAPGDTNGQGVGDNFFVVPADLENDAAVTLSFVTNDELGDIIVAENGFTLYQFTPDDNNCVDGCLQTWPPLLADSADDIALADGRLTGEVGIFEAVDGRSQVTYNGAPLYFFSNDAAPGDTNGQGIGDVWFVVPAQTTD